MSQRRKQSNRVADERASAQIAATGQSRAGRLKRQRPLRLYYAKAAEIIAKNQLAEKIRELWKTEILVLEDVNKKGDRIKVPLLMTTSRRRMDTEMVGKDGLWLPSIDANGRTVEHGGLWLPSIDADDLYGPVHHALQHCRRRKPTSRKPTIAARRGRPPHVEAEAAVRQLSALYARSMFEASPSYSHRSKRGEYTGEFFEAVRLIFRAAGCDLKDSGYAKLISRARRKR